jgi:fumarylacetoacetase
VTPLAALESARVPAPPQTPPVLPYLAEAERFTYRLDLVVEWNGVVVTRPPFAEMYWTPAQQLAHMTVNGAALRTGDLYASGTVSGRERSQVGSFLELTWGGREPVSLPGGVLPGGVLPGRVIRTFLEDGDAVAIRATAPGPNGAVISLGEVTGKVLAARDRL